MNKYSEWTDVAVNVRIGTLRSIDMLYAFDMNTATELLKECNGSLWFDFMVELWEVVIEFERYTPGEPDHLMVNCEQPARAVCEAWLLWKDAQQQEGGGS